MNKKALLNALEIALNYIKAVRSGPLEYGWHDKSIGTKVFFEQKSKEYWIRLTCLKHLRKNEDNIIKKYNLLNSIPGIKKPLFHQYGTYTINGDSYEITIWDFINNKTLSTNPLAHKSLKIEESFLKNLKQQLSHLYGEKIDFLACRQELISRRLRERYQIVEDVMIKNWGAIHGDIHWANLTHDCYLLDWEGYGIGPKALDPSFLYCFSLLNQDLTKKIGKIFSDVFKSRDGYICLLFAAAEILRMTELYKDYIDLYFPLNAFTKNLILNKDYYLEDT